MSKKFTPTRRNRVKELRYKHQQVMDLIVAKPDVTLRELSEVTGYTVPWLSSLIRSDAFQKEYQSRRADINALVARTVRERIEGIAHAGLEEIERRLTDEPEEVSDRTLLDTADMAIKALGFGAPKPAASVQFNIGVDRSVLENARARATGRVIEGEKESV